MVIKYVLSVLFWSFLVWATLFCKIVFIYFRREGREKKRNNNVEEKHRWVASLTSPTQDLACNPGMCPYWESNQQPSSLQAGAQPAEPHQPGPGPLLRSYLLFYMHVLFLWLDCKHLMVGDILYEGYITKIGLAFPLRFQYTV